MHCPNKIPLFIAIALTAVIVNLDSTAANLAVKTIAEQLNMNMATAQWVIDGFSMATAAFIAFGGRCGDVYGRKKVFQMGLIAFGVSSAAIAFSPNATCIIIGRILQGMSLAFCLPIAIALIRDVFPAEEVPKFTGFVISIGSLSQAIGPTLGGFIIHLSSWRWIFFVNLPVIALALYFIYYYLPDKKPMHKEKLDKLGLYYLVIGLSMLLIGFNEFAKPVIDVINIVLLFTLALVTLGLFAQRELFFKNPLLNIRTIMNPNFAKVLVVRFILSLNYISWLYLFGLLLQNIFDYSAMHAGFILLALTLAMALVSQQAGQLINRKGLRHLKILGLWLIFFVNIAFAASFYFLNLPILIVFFIFAGAGVAICVTTTGVGTVQTVEPIHTSTATGIQMTAAFVGSAIGVSLTSAILSKVSHWKLMHLLAEQHIQLPNNVLDKVTHAASGLQDLPFDLLANHPVWLQALPNITNHAFGFAFIFCMLLYAILGLVALVCSYALPKTLMTFE